MKRVHRLAVATHHGVRRLCKLTDSGNGSLKITFAPKPRFAFGSDIHQLLALSAADFSEPRESSGITIHSSSESSVLNQINFHDAIPYKTLYTSALKRENLFVPIWYQIVSNLSADRHELNELSDDCDSLLTSIDTTKDTFIFGIVLGPKGKPFEQIPEHPSNLMQVPFKDFDLWIIWSLYNQPARESSINLKVLGGSRTQPVTGWQNWEIYNLHTDVVLSYSDAFFKSA